VNCDYLAQEIRRIGVDRPITKLELFGANIPNGDQPSAERQTDRLKVVYCGRFARSKQVIELVDAVIAIADNYPTLELALIGVTKYSSKEYLNKLTRKIASLPNNIDIKIRSNLSPNAVVQSIALADLLVLPSRHEGFGMPVAEALALGTPVLCSDAASLPEVAGGFAALFRAGDAVSLRNALSEALGAGPGERFGWLRASWLCGMAEFCDRLRPQISPNCFRTALAECNSATAQPTVD
jgi:glycosyltransferase involved in cell wall biosynthesis